MKVPSREDDERLVSALRLRAAGHTIRTIADALGYASPEAARIACLRVIAADLAESGEDPDLVGAAYSPTPSVAGDVKCI